MSLEDEIFEDETALPVGGLSAAKIGKRYEDLQRQYGEAAKSNQALFAAAMERLRAERVGPTTAEKLFAISSALSRPTRTGKFVETLGNVGSVLGAQEAEKRKAQMERAAMLEKYGFGQSDATIAGLESQLDMGLNMQAAAEAARRAERTANMPSATVRTIQYALTLPENNPERKLILASVSGTPENIAASVARAAGVQDTKPPPKTGKAKYIRGEDGKIYRSRD